MFAKRRKSFVKKIISALLVAAIVIVMSFNVFAYGIEEVTIDYIDHLLREANTPESQIEAMDDALKRTIYENSLCKADVEYIEVTREQTAGSMAKSVHDISESDLELSVVAYKESGENQVAIYPSYEWLTPIEPNGKDYFSYSTHSSFSVVPGERSNSIYAKLHSDDPWEYAGSADYTGTSVTGYEHFGDSLGTPDFPIYIKGHFYFKVDIDVANPVNKIVIAYVHDTSWGSNVSYSVGYGPLSISVTPSSNNVSYLNNAFTLHY